MYIAFLSQKEKPKLGGGELFFPQEEGRTFSLVVDSNPKRHRLAEVLRALSPKGDFSIATQSDLLAYGLPKIKASRSIFMVKVNSLYELAEAAYQAVLGGVYSVYGQRIFEFETATHSRWRVAIFSSLPGDVNRYFSHLSPSDVRTIRHSNPPRGG